MKRTVSPPAKQPSRKPGFAACEALLADRPDAPERPADRDFHQGRSVFITGAGGSIGGMLARRIAAFHPAALLLLDTAEHGLFKLDEQLSRVAPGVRRRLVVGSCGDESLMRDLLQDFSPDVTYHAAAHKHVPLMEQNPFAAITNNALGTWRLARTLGQSGGGRLLMISTDKAANPASIMGASKRIAEIALASHSRSGMPMSSIRLGNVLGTQGSVLATFQSQLRAGGPLTVTHPHAERFFLRNEDAVTLILDAMRCCEVSEVVAPAVEAGIRVLDLAEYMIAKHRAKSGTSPGIAMIGLREGEKVREVFVGDSELQGGPVGNLLRRVHPPAGNDDLAEAMDGLQRAAEERDLDALLQAVRRLVPDYKSSSFLTAAMAARSGRSPCLSPA
jgi:FlaA1/EpsC-like NDP-sugar epimerase